ncbi:MAG TPA: CBS domain-containing protein, partial [Spirochaetota bacterium]|nr:CBS domain-containing protein [Spirochaetota bacterium]
MSKSGFFKNLFNKNVDTEEIPLSSVIKQVEEGMSSYDKKMILNIIEMSKTMVKEIMVPRVEVVSIDKNSELDEIIQIVESKGRSRLPVFDDNIDNIIGVLHSKDLLRYVGKRSDFDIKKIIRQPFFIPETKNINDLLLELREKKIHLAIVVDEFGGMA